MQKFGGVLLICSGAVMWFSGAFPHHIHGMQVIGVVVRLFQGGMGSLAKHLSAAPGATILFLLARPLCVAIGGTMRLFRKVDGWQECGGAFHRWSRRLCYELLALGVGISVGGARAYHVRSQVPGHDEYFLLAFCAVPVSLVYLAAGMSKEHREKLMARDREEALHPPALATDTSSD